jgi:HlyD family secretion protein
MTRSSFTVTCVACLILGCGLGAYVFGQDALSLFENGTSTAKASVPPLPERYRTAAVKRSVVRQTVTATGTLNALVTIEVGTQLSGQLAKVFVDFNDDVKRGQPLAELDRRSFQAKRAEARAATIAAQTLVAVQKSRVERARVDIRDAQAKGAVLQARLESAKARLNGAENALRRVAALQAKGVSSGTQLDQAETERDAAAANFKEAEASAGANMHAVAAAQVDLQRAEAELANAEAGVPQREAAQLLAEIDLERTIIRSPIDGVVVGRSFSEGQTVAASLEAPTLFTIAGDLERMEIHARVDESDIGKIRVGQRATFTVDAYPGRQFEAEVAVVRKAPQQTQPGSVLRRAPPTSSNVVTYIVVLRTSNPGGLLLPGMTAMMRIIVDEAKDVLTVPMAAFRFTPQGQESREKVAQPHAHNRELVWVWNNAERRAKPITVQVGTSDGVHAALIGKAMVEELREGDQVLLGEALESSSKRPFGMKLGF